MRKAGHIRIGRIYDEESRDEPGARVLTDRLWPRGITKERAALDLWLKDVAPSTELRQWFHHEPEHWAEFQRRYLAELAHNPAVAELRALVAKGPVLLLYGARDTEHNQAVVLKEYLERS
ncbi:MAG TPA: DUF488 domain-containing protein [Reyranella sp.]